MSRPSRTIDAAARFLAADPAAVEFVPRKRGRAALLRRGDAALKLAGASALDLHAVEHAMLAVHNALAARGGLTSDE